MTMRVITMHKTNAADEAFTPPTQELIEGMGRLVGDIQKAGLLLEGEGLLPTSRGVRLTFRGGERTLQPGPFKGANELIDRYLVVKTRSIDEAIDWATRFIGGDDAEVDVRPFTEAWDLGMAPKPEDAPTRYMIARKADAKSEAGGAESPSFRGLADEMKRAGVLLGTERIQPSAKGSRVTYANGVRAIVDGPYTESKEVVGGYLMMRVETLDEVYPWLDRFAACFGDVEIDVRPMYE